MNHKVLLADDSLTIQKVIKITLANQPFDIVECSSEEELFKKLPEVKPELVLLDFNLSEKFTGYDLTARIKEALPTARVLLLLGTFDNVDDAALEKSGASDKIVKPFDSNKFIAICKKLVDIAGSSNEIVFPTPKKEEFIVPKEDDQWTINHTVEHVEKKVLPTQPQSFESKPQLNPLNQEISDWGMSIPAIINEDGSHDKVIDLPPVIGEVKSDLDKTHSSLKNPKFPDDDDLGYPSIEIQSEKPLSMGALDKTGEFEVEHHIDSLNESDVSKIEAQIRDEVEEDLWRVDEFEDLKKEVSAKIEEVKNNFPSQTQNFDENLFKPLDDNESIPWTASETKTDENFNLGSVSHEQLVQELMPKIEAVIERQVKQYMDQYFSHKTEKIAWEVIPDLAENLIRQEISKISNKILNDSN